MCCYCVVWMGCWGITMKIAGMISSHYRNKTNALASVCETPQIKGSPTNIQASISLADRPLFTGSRIGSSVSILLYYVLGSSPW